MNAANVAGGGTGGLSPADMASMAKMLGLKVLSPAELDAVMAKTKEDSKREAAEALVREKQEAWERLCPEEFREPWDWAKCRAPKAEVLKVLNWKYQKRGLFLLGDTGHCKSRAIWKLLEKLYLEQGKKMIVLTGTQFANQAAAAYGDCATAEAWTKKLARVDLLFVDDLGKRWTPSTEEAAFDIVDRRTAAQLPIFITSNYDAEQLAAISAGRGGGRVAADMVTPLFRRILDYTDQPVF